MAVRTTQTLVATVIDITPGDDLTAQIASANIIVTDQCTNSGYDDTRLEMIERWLSAHMYACNRRRTSNETVSEGAGQGFDRINVDLGLNNTIYGQQAMMIDTAGNLAAMVNSMKTVKKILPVNATQVVWLGQRWRNAGCW